MSVAKKRHLVISNFTGMWVSWQRARVNRHVTSKLMSLIICNYKCKHEYVYRASSHQCISQRYLINQNLPWNSAIWLIIYLPGQNPSQVRCFGMLRWHKSRRECHLELFSHGKLRQTERNLRKQTPSIGHHDVGSFCSGRSASVLNHLLFVVFINS